MNVVLYTQQLEAVTVIDLPMWAIERLQHGERIKVPVPVKWEVMAKCFEPIAIQIDHVTITAEELCRNGESTWMLFVDDDAKALALRSSLLPGQIADRQSAVKGAFVRGLLAALG